jgi:protein-disulfide isomerase
MRLVTDAVSLRSRVGYMSIFPRSAVLAAGMLAAVLAMVAASAGETQAEISPSHRTDDPVVARIGRDPVTVGSIVGRAKDAFDQLEVDYDLKVRRLQLKRDQARYELIQQQTEKLLDDTALTLEASSRRVSKEQVLAEIKVPVVTEQEANAFYETRRLRTQESFEQLQPEIIKYLAGKHNAEATRRFYDELRTKHHIVVVLEPYRVAVDAIGPARGKQQAAITIVEFGDFECIYCREAESTLRAVMAHHADDVRLVFRNLPLESLHPNAMTAAEAGVCADRQGKFWPMHDAMYDDQNSLTEPALKETAKRLGLDADGFAACLADPATKVSVRTDASAADQLNLSSTPSFLINGRPLQGSVPLDKFESIIDDELQRVRSRKQS